MTSLPSLLSFSSTIHVQLALCGYLSECVFTTHVQCVCAFVGVSVLMSQGSSALPLLQDSPHSTRPTHQRPACLPVCLPALRSVCLLACLPTLRSVCRPACLSVWATEVAETQTLTTPCACKPLRGKTNDLPQIVLCYSTVFSKVLSKHRKKILTYIYKKSYATHEVCYSKSDNLYFLLT